LGATEGINVLMEKKSLDGKWEYGVSCVEYTEFDKFGITTGPLAPERCVFPGLDLFQCFTLKSNLGFHTLN